MLTKKNWSKLKKWLNSESQTFIFRNSKTYKSEKRQREGLDFRIMSAILKWCMKLNFYRIFFFALRSRSRHSRSIIQRAFWRSWNLKRNSQFAAHHLHVSIIFFNLVSFNLNTWATASFHALDCLPIHSNFQYLFSLMHQSLSKLSICLFAQVSRLLKTAKRNIFKFLSSFLPTTLRDALLNFWILRNFSYPFNLIYFNLHRQPNHRQRCKWRWKLLNSIQKPLRWKMIFHPAFCDSFHRSTLNNV